MVCKMIQTLSSEIVNKSIILNIGMHFDKLRPLMLNTQIVNNSMISQSTKHAIVFT